MSVSGRPAVVGLARQILREGPVGLAYQVETGVRDLLAAGARKRGWTPAAFPYPGYATTRQARVLGRVVLAPSTVEPSALRGVAGWRRLLTLERPGVDLEVDLEGTAHQLASGPAGIVDAVVRVEAGLPAGPARVSFRLPGREPVTAAVYLAAEDAVTGLVCDIDDTVWITGLTHPLRAAWRTLMGHSSTRRSVPGMAGLLRAAVEGVDNAPVIYLSNGPWNLLGPVSRFLSRHRFPPGALLMTDWGITPRRWFRDGRRHKASALDRLATDFPRVRWILIGDDGEHDPEIYADFAATHPTHVSAIALRQVRSSKSHAKPPSSNEHADVPTVRGANGDELLSRLMPWLRTHDRPR